MSKSIRGATLLSLNDRGFKSHNAKHAWIAQHNSGNRVVDPRLALCEEIEHLIRSKLSSRLIETEYRVLRWQEEGIRFGHTTRYRELDAVYAIDSRNFIILEVKASCSKSSIKGGIKQLQRSVRILQTTYSAAAGVLVVVNLGLYTKAFGCMATDFDMNHYKQLNGLIEIEWPIMPSVVKSPNLFICFLPTHELEQFLNSSPELKSKMLKINSMGF